MTHLKISTRLVTLIGFMSLLLLGIGSIGLYGIVKADDALQNVYEDRTVPMGQQLVQAVAVFKLGQGGQPWVAAPAAHRA